MEIGKLREVQLREVWAHEAQQFTPWLAANPGELGEALGLDLVFENTEVSVGDFSLDLLGRDLRSGKVVIVENQLGQTDHSHLGQLLTYAAGRKPQIIVWVAKRFRDEHKAALEWLNNVTHVDTMFFGVVVKAVRIGDSPPAPVMEIVVEPNTWSKALLESSSVNSFSEKRQTYQTFWEELLEILAKEFPELQNKSAQPQSWLPTSTGVTNVNLTLVFTSKGLRVEYYFESPEAEINKARFGAVYAMREEFEKTTGRAVDWELLETKKACRISSSGVDGADVMNLDDWPIYRDWFLSAYHDYKKANTDSFRQAIKLAKPNI